MLTYLTSNISSLDKDIQRLEPEASRNLISLDSGEKIPAEKPGKELKIRKMRRGELKIKKDGILRTYRKFSHLLV